MEGEVCIRIRKFDETTFGVSIKIDGRLIFDENISTNTSEYPFPYFLYINKSVLNMTNGEVNVSLAGFTVESRLLYFEGCKYHLLCGHGEQYSQVVVLASDFQIVLVILVVLLVVS